MAVAIKRDGDRGVAHVAAESLRVSAGGDHERRVGMTAIMQTHRLEARRRPCLASPSQRAAGVERTTCPTGEDEAQRWVNILRPRADRQSPAPCSWSDTTGVNGRTRGASAGAGRVHSSEAPTAYKASPTACEHAPPVPQQATPPRPHPPSPNSARAASAYGWPPGSPAATPAPPQASEMSAESVSGRAETTPAPGTTANNHIAPRPRLHTAADDGQQSPRARDVDAAEDRWFQPLLATDRHS